MKAMIACFISVGILLSCSSAPKKELRSKEYAFYDGIEKVIADLKGELIKKKIKLAIMPVLNENSDKTLLGDNTSNLLQTGLFEPKSYTLVERERVDSILEEYEFSKTGLVDENTLKQIGKLLSVDSLVVGTLRDEGNVFSFFIRVIDIEKGKVQAISNVRIVKDNNLQNQYNRIVEFSQKNYEGAYNLKIDKIVVSEKDKQNLPWDAMSRGDIMFEVYVSDNKIYTSKIYTEFPSLNLKESIDLVLRNNEPIFIIVYDEDVTDHQLIGKISLMPDDIRKYVRKENITIENELIKEMILSLKKM